MALPAPQMSRFLWTSLIPVIRSALRLYGIFFEDINFAGDGGLNAELVKNGAFEFTDALMGWTEVKEGTAAGNLSISNDDAPYPDSPHFLHIGATTPGNKYGAANGGYRGMGVRAGETYVFSAQIRSTESPDVGVRLAVVSSDGRELTHATIPKIGAQWSAEDDGLTAKRNRWPRAVGRCAH